MNDFGSGVDGRDTESAMTPDFTALPDRIDGREHARNPYNRVVTQFLAQSLDRKLVAEGETASWDALAAAQRCNEQSRCRNVGFSVETRPDCVTRVEVERLRALGCTKIQIGIQSLSDEVLAANRRGHDVAATRRAMTLLRGAGFKVHAHWMPNLLGSTPERDVADFSRLFDEAGFRPDELKVYPCSLIESAELMQHYERGDWSPYSYEELERVLHGVFDLVPRYCRLTRVIRDISSDDIVAGNKLTNFREIAQRSHAKRGGRTLDIRAREIGAARVERTDLTLRTTAYRTSVGEERFLEFTTSEDRIAGFVRLSLPEIAAPIAEIDGAAVIREVHVYGPALTLGARSDGNAQHRGLGSELVAEAGRQALAAGFENVAVISAVGTRAYYRKLGFLDGELYQHLWLGRD
jgi:elongator complex protein 3